MVHKYTKNQNITPMMMITFFEVLSRKFKYYNKKKVHNKTNRLQHGDKLKNLVIGTLYKII